MNKAEIALLQQRLDKLKQSKERILKIKKDKRTVHQVEDLEQIHTSISNVKNWIKDGR